MAWQRKRDLLKDLEDEDHNPYDYVPGGRPPSTRRGIAKRRNAIANHRKQHSLNIANSTGQMLLLGVVVPTILFGLGTFFYFWFDPSVAPLVDAMTLAPVAEVSGWQLGTYIADHLLRGGLFDLMEVFRLRSTTVTNNIHAYPYSIGVFAYHLYVEVFLLFAFGVISKAIFLLVRAIREPQVFDMPES